MSTDVLQRLLARPRKVVEYERCEMCAAQLPDEHSHVVHLEARSLLCACRPCALLFMNSNAAAGRYKTVPDRYVHDPAFTLSDAQWDTLQIPVGMVFLFTNSRDERVIAFYPGPAGATECSLPLDEWAEVCAANPALTAAEPDVEAVLLRRHDGGIDAHLVPIDACYRLVGLVRTTWKGFDGGEEAHNAIDAFFADLRERSGTQA